MVDFRDFQHIVGYSNSSKKIEEQAHLQRLLDKKTEAKTQEKTLQEALNVQKAQDAKSYETFKSQFSTQFKVLDQVAKQLNVNVQDLNVQTLKQALYGLNDKQAEIIQNIIKQEQLTQLKQEHQKLQLKNKGVEQQFTKEMQLVETISKALKTPIEQLNAADIQKFIQLLRKNTFENSSIQEKIDKITKELGISKDNFNVKDLQQLLSSFKKQQFSLKQNLKENTTKTYDTKTDARLDKLEARQEEIQKVLDRLKGKQSEIFNKLSSKDEQSQKVLEKQINTLQVKAEELEQNLQKLNSQIKKTLDKDKKMELEIRKTELEVQTKELKNSLKQLQIQKYLGKEESLNQKTDRGLDAKQEQVQTQTRIQELTTQEKELMSKLEKAPDETKANQIKEELSKVSKEKEALFKQSEVVSKEVFNKQKPQADMHHIKDSVLKEVSSKLEKMETDIRFKEVFEKEINEQSSKEAKEKVAELKNILKEVQVAKETIKDVSKLRAQDRAEAMKQMLNEIKSEQVKTRLENILRQSIRTADLIRNIVSGDKTNITDTEAILLSTADLDSLNGKDLSKVFDAIGDKVSQLKVSVKSMEALKNNLKVEAKELKQKRGEVATVLRQIVYEKSKGNLGVDELRSLFNTSSLGREAVEALMYQFENLQSTESQIQFILLLRNLFAQDVEALKMLLSVLVKEGKIEQSFIEEELGLLFTSEERFKGEKVSKEAMEILSKLTGISVERMAENEELRQIIAKGRIDRKNFSRLFKKAVSKDAWDYGVISFNKQNVGILKERAELNSLFSFWKLMQRFSREERDTLETATLFLTYNKLTSYQREIVSFFIIQYQEHFIDPDFHLFDLYKKYMDGNTFEQLSDQSREELCLAVFFRLLKSMEGPDKHSQLERIFEFTKYPEDSLEFIRSVEILEYYFSQGGLVKQEFLDIKKELRLFDSVTQWEDAFKADLEESTISKVVAGFSMPVKKLESVRLGRLSDRLKKK